MKEFSNKEVIIIAGPSASGKSYIIRQLKTTKKNKLKLKIFRKLSINPRKSKSCISISALKNSSKKPKHIRKLNKKVIFIHFDLTGRHQKQKRHLLLRYQRLQKNKDLDSVYTIQRLARTNAKSLQTEPDLYS